MKSIVIEILAILIGFVGLSIINPFLAKFALLGYFLYKLITRRYLFYTLKGRKLYDNGNKEDALQYFEKASNSKFCKPRVYVSYAYLLLIEGKLDDCEKMLNMASKFTLASKDNLNARITLALLNWKKNNLDESINILEELYKENKSITLYEGLGYLLILSGDYEKALKFNLEALEYDSSSSIINDNVAESYYFLGDIEKAKKIYYELTQSPLSFSEPYYYYGLIHKEEGDLESAERLFKRALKCPDSLLTGLSKETIKDKLTNLQLEKKQLNCNDQLTVP